MTPCTGTIELEGLIPTVLGHMTDITYFKKSDHLEAKKVAWRTAIGRFLLEFASIEWFTFHILNELPSERIFESTRTLPFGKRVDLVIQLIEDKEFDEDLATRATSLLRESVTLSKKRNILAHSPLRLNLFDEAVGKDLKYVIGKFDKTDVELTYEDLDKLCIEVERVSRELDMVIDEFRKILDIP